MSDELVRRLTAVVPYQGKSAIAFMCHEAAEGIEALEAQVERLREALWGMLEYTADLNPLQGHSATDCDAVKIARAALASAEHPANVPSHVPKQVDAEGEV